MQMMTTRRQARCRLIFIAGIRSAYIMDKGAILMYSQIVVVVFLFPTEYKQWRTEYISGIVTTMKP